MKSVLDFGPDPPKKDPPKKDAFIISSLGYHRKKPYDLAMERRPDDIQAMIDLVVDIEVDAEVAGDIAIELQSELEDVLKDYYSEELVCAELAWIVAKLSLLQRLVAYQSKLIKELKGWEE